MLKTEESLGGRGGGGEGNCFGGNIRLGGCPLPHPHPKTLCNSAIIIIIVFLYCSAQNASGSYDYNDGDSDPMPNLKNSADNTHGTKYV